MIVAGVAELVGDVVCAFTFNLVGPVRGILASIVLCLASLVAIAFMGGLNYIGALVLLFIFIIAWEYSWVAALGVVVHIVPEANRTMTSFLTGAMGVGAVAALVAIDPLWNYAKLVSCGLVAAGLEFLSLVAFIVFGILRRRHLKNSPSESLSDLHEESNGSSSVDTSSPQSEPPTSGSPSTSTGGQSSTNFESDS